MVLYFIATVIGTLLLSLMICKRYVDQMNLQVRVLQSENFNMSKDNESLHLRFQDLEQKYYRVLRKEQFINEKEFDMIASKKYNVNLNSMNPLDRTVN